MDGLKARLSFDAVAYDYDDEYLTIDTDTHTININNVSRLFGVQYDGNSKLIKFRIRNKLSDIQKMQDSIVYINWIDQKGVKGQSIAIDKTISNDICEFAWKVPFDALKNSGVLHFAMSAVITENNSSVINQKWSTQIASVTTPDGIYIKSYTPSSEEEDRIAQIYNELSKMINKQNDNLQSQVNSLKEDVINHSDKVNFITGAYQYSNGFKIGAPQKGGTFDSSITNRCYTIIEANIKNFYINVNKMYQYNVIVANKVDDKYYVVFNSNIWSQGENFYDNLVSKYKGNSLIVLFRDKNDLVINDSMLNEIKNSIIVSLDNSVYSDRNKRIVDVFMFMGQSNMAGRGITNAEHPEKVPTIMSGAGYEYRAISDDTKLSNIEEPFGKNENVSGAIDDGSDKTGSMVTSFVNAYYSNNGNIPVVAVSASQGGTLSSQWVANSAKLNDAINRLNKTIEFLNKNGYSIRNKYMVWCQGESDADSNYSKDTWTNNFKSMLNGMMSAGIEKCFMVRIGNCNIEGSEDRYKNMISWQTEMAQTNKNVVMVSCDFAGMKNRGLMKDQFHYYQAGYNECGTYAGINTAYYVTSEKEPTMYDTEDGSLYYSHKN
jgi:hypothetical protein